MPQFFLQSSEPLIIVHGGAGPMDPSSAGIKTATAGLQEAANAARAALAKSGLQAVVAALKSMEANEVFNAGIGSSLQADGVARVTSAVMDGTNQTFSGVIGGNHLKHASELALHLQGKSARVLGPPGIDLLARELGIKPTNIVTARRIEQWLNSSKKVEWTCDTVGCVIKDAEGQLFAGTSTASEGPPQGSLVKFSCSKFSRSALVNCWFFCQAGGSICRKA